LQEEDVINHETKAANDGTFTRERDVNLIKLLMTAPFPFPLQPAKAANDGTFSAKAANDGTFSLGTFSLLLLLLLLHRIT
jgi:hypothetical protein